MTTKEGKAERIAKRLARAGMCSRREAEAWIRAGRVAVDGTVLESPAVTVTDANAITVDGQPLPAAEPTRLWRYHKPAGLVTTTRDPQGRPTVFDDLPADLPRVVTVGRLDLTSEGLLLLTNDGELARRLELPATGWLRRYRVRVRGRVDAAALETLAGGMEIDGVQYGPIRARLDRQMPTNAWLTVALAEGRNREVRRICEHLGWPVLRLIRLSYGPFQLGRLKPGEVAEVPARVLREQIGSTETPASSQRARKRRFPRPAAADGGRTAKSDGPKKKGRFASAGETVAEKGRRPRKGAREDREYAETQRGDGRADRRRKP